jgi:hypothetical protein
MSEFSPIKLLAPSHDRSKHGFIPSPGDAFHLFFPLDALRE